jgi:hypothetical protein
MDRRRAGRRRPAAQPRRTGGAIGVLREALHGLERLLPRARGIAHRPLHASDGLHDHRGQHARPRVPDLGDDAPRARLPHPLVRQVAPHASRQLVDEGRRRKRARALRLRGRRVSLARRSPRAGLASGPAHRREVRRVVRPGGRRRAVVRDGVVREPPRHRLVVRVEWPRPGGGQRRERRAAAAAELRDARTADRRQQATTATLVAGHGGELLRARAVLGARRHEHMAAVPRPLHEAAARGRPAHRKRPAHAGQPPEGGGQHGGRVHLRPRRVRGIARPAREGRRRLRGGDPRAADGERPSRHPHARAANPTHAAHLERRHRPAAADDRHRLERLAARPALRAHRSAPRSRERACRPVSAGSAIRAPRHR